MRDDQEKREAEMSYELGVVKDAVSLFLFWGSFITATHYFPDTKNDWEWFFVMTLFFVLSYGAAQIMTMVLMSFVTSVFFGSEYY
jgi:hypothetical protein